MFGNEVDESFLWDAFVDSLANDDVRLSSVLLVEVQRAKDQLDRVKQGSLM
jgi:hypothetical protein